MDLEEKEDLEIAINIIFANKESLSKQEAFFIYRKFAGFPEYLWQNIEFATLLWQNNDTLLPFKKCGLI
jgi:hypothetical protein